MLLIDTINSGVKSKLNVIIDYGNRLYFKQSDPS